MIKKVSGVKMDNEGTYVEVTLAYKYGDKTLLVDHVDFILHVEGRNWCVHKSGTGRKYACNSRKFYARICVGPRSSTKPVYLHRLLMRAPVGMVVDHKDTNGLNCRRYNMFLTVQKDNAKRQVHTARRK